MTGETEGDRLRDKVIMPTEDDMFDIETESWRKAKLRGKIEMVVGPLALVLGCTIIYYHVQERLEPGRFALVTMLTCFSGPLVFWDGFRKQIKKPPTRGNHTSGVDW